MALTRVYGRVVRPHGDDALSPVTGDGVIEYVHSRAGVLDGAVHGPDRVKVNYVDGVAADAWLKPGAWRGYVTPQDGRAYDFTLGIPDAGEVTLANAIGLVVTDEVIVVKGDPGKDGEPGPPGEPGAPGEPGPPIDVSWEGTALRIGNLEPVDLKGEPGEGGGGAGGGFYINEDGEQVQYVMVASEQEPEPTIVIDGRTYEVWWVQTSPSGPDAWVPELVTQAEGSRAFVVPADAGAVYTVDGMVRAAGTYAVPGMDAASVSWSAAPRSGYTFAPGAVTSGTLEFPARTYQPGDVVFSDSFAREGALAGSSTDSFEGGDPLTWVNHTTLGSVNRTSAGVLRGVRSGDGVAVFAWDELVMPAPFANADIFLVAKVVDAAVSGTEEGIYLRAGSAHAMKITPTGATILYAPSAQSFPTAPGTAEGDLLRIEYRSGQVPKTHNLTRGTASSYTGTYTPTPVEFDRVRVDLRPPNSTPIGTTTRVGFDSLKVVAQ